MLVSGDVAAAAEDVMTMPNPAAWLSLSAGIRAFDPDIVVLVARKMPRLVRALNLDLGPRAICISDQAVPFAFKELRGARVAIVDDVWNVGTTMRHAAARVKKATPRSVRMFALAAKTPAAAQQAGVQLAIQEQLSKEDYQALVESVPDRLRLVPLPYDADFPIVPCALRSPFSSWAECWYWLESRFGDDVHSNVDETQLRAGLARATINFNFAPNWTIKTRLYFDFNHQSCNVVTLALAPSLPLRNDYPEGSASRAICSALEAALSVESDVSDDGQGPDLFGFARINTFCDSILVMEDALSCLSGLLHRADADPFDFGDARVQFGPSAADRCRIEPSGLQRRLNSDEFRRYAATRSTVGIGDRRSLLQDNDFLAARARDLLKMGLPALALDSLMNELSDAAGSNDPSLYRLNCTFSREQIIKEPFLRLRIGFSYDELVAFFREHLDTSVWTSRPAALTVSALLDAFIDRGAIVPTTVIDAGRCIRVYRKGEANPAWDEEIARMQFLLESLSDAKRQELVEKGRTRVAKIAAIMAYSAEVDTSIVPSPFERGTVGVLSPSVAERDGGELVGVMRRLGLWK